MNRDRRYVSTHVANPKMIVDSEGVVAPATTYRRRVICWWEGGSIGAWKDASMAYKICLELPVEPLMDDDGTGKCGDVLLASIGWSSSMMLICEHESQRTLTGRFVIGVRRMTAGRLDRWRGSAATEATELRMRG